MARKLHDISGTITSGGTAQALDVVRPGSICWMVQNNSAADLWVNDMGGTAAASQPAIKIPTGVTFVTPVGYEYQGALSIFGGTTAQAFTARRW